jgi:hypothetical protein
MRPASPQRPRPRLDRFVAAAVAALVAAAVAAPAGATRVAPMTWRELIDDADFIGVVECTVAGGIVARYRVVETWHGVEEPGATVALRRAVDYWAGQYPVALAGDRFLVTAFRERTPETIASTAEAGSSPLWWRRLEADYRLPLHFGSVALPLDEGEGRPLATLGSERRDLAAFRRDVEGFLALGRDERRRRLGRPPAPPVEAPPGATTAGDAAVVEAPPGAAGAGDGAPDRPAPPSPRELARLRGALGKVPRQTDLTPFADPAVARAFALLAEHSPGAVAWWLGGWRQLDYGPQLTADDTGYVLASYFGWRVGRDPARQLRRLFASPEPPVRVAAAVYLALHGEVAAATAALRELAALPGDAGAWAALTLARRGERAAVPRAIEALNPVHTGNTLPLAHLESRVMELLSNTAAAAGLAPPWTPVPHTGIARELATAEIYRSHLDWWRAHGDRATPTDPWLAELAGQKID